MINTHVTTPRYCEHSGLLWKLFTYRPHYMVGNFKQTTPEQHLNFLGKYSQLNHLHQNPSLGYIKILSMFCGLGWKPAVTLYYSIVDWLPTLVVVPSVTHKPGHAGWGGKRGERSLILVWSTTKRPAFIDNKHQEAPGTKKRQVLFNERPDWPEHSVCSQTGKVALIWLADSGCCGGRDNVSNIAAPKRT